MRIFRLELRDLKRYRELQIDLAPGLTIIRGPNEAGKSTIARAIELVLTQPAGEDRPDIEQLRSWDAGAAARPTVTMDFTDDADGVARTGSVRKVFGHGGAATLTIDAVSTSDPGQVDSGLAEISGVPNAAFFRSTALVDQGELDELDRDETVLRERLTASISAADGDTRQAVHALEVALADLHGQGGGDPGRLHIAEEAVKRSEVIVATGEAAMAKLVDDRLALGRAQESLATARDQLADSKNLLEQARHAETLQAQLTAATERHERYAEAVTVDEALHVLHRTHPSPEPLAVLRSGVARLRGLDTKGKELRAQLAGEVQVDFQLTEPSTRWKPIVAIGVLGILAGIVVAIAAFFVNGQPTSLSTLTTTTEVLLAVGAGIAVVGLILLLIGLRQRRAIGAFERQKQLARHRDRPPAARAVPARGRAPPGRGPHEGPARARSACPTWPRARRCSAKEEAHVAPIDEHSARLSGLVGKEPSESLPASRDAARKAEADAASAALGELVPEAREAASHDAVHRRGRGGRGALERARDDEANARARVEANAVDAEQVAGEAERLAGWRGQLAACSGAPASTSRPSRPSSAPSEATMDRDPLPREAHGRATSPGSPTAATAASGSTTNARRSRCSRPEKADWVDVRDLSARDAGPGLPGGAPGARPPGHRRPPAAARLRRSVRHVRRLAGGPGLRRAHEFTGRLPGHLPDHLRPL